VAGKMEILTRNATEIIASGSSVPVNILLTYYGAMQDHIQTADIL